MASCNVCKLRRVRPIPPLMGPLPEDRLEPNGWPFKYTGLDYFGPQYVTIGRRTEKRWVALFTCLTTRAVHLEIAYDFSIDSCIIAMRNFMCHRGPVVRTSLEQSIRPESLMMSSNQKRSRMSCHPKESNGFSTVPRTQLPGIWERMVQCVKKVLAHTVKEVAPKEDVLMSFLIGGA